MVFVFIFLAALFSLIGAAILSDIDEHYQYIALTPDPDDAQTTFVQSAADTDTVIQVDDARIKPELIFNGFAKGRHGVMVWDVKRFVLRLLFSLPKTAADNAESVLISIQSDNNREMPVAANRSVSTPALSDWVDGVELQVDNDETAAGKAQLLWDRIRRLVQEKENIDGFSFGRLLTSAHYAIGIGSTAGFSAAPLQIQLGMDARRVMVPLTEVFFDQQSLDAFLGQIALAAINI